jgi:hypothetical protein
MKRIDLKFSGVIKKHDHLVRKSDNWCDEVNRCSFWKLPLFARYKFEIR